MYRIALAGFRRGAAPMQRGKVLAEKYRLDFVLGRGGMGSVWRAEHLGLGAPVAVKLMDPALALTPDALARFHKEARAAATVRSPHVVQVLDHGVDEPSNTPFIVMELLEGETLGERLGREGKLSAQKTAGLVADVCRALTRAHQAGIVHRDLKPDNIFLVKHDPEFAKVLDFGVAKSRTLAGQAGIGSSTGPLFGTPRYMSPEQINGSSDLDGRSDLWSVAVIAFECITGRCPFDGENLSQLLLAICTQPPPVVSSLGPVNPVLDAWFARALERDPALRFQTARDLSDAFSAATASAGERDETRTSWHGDRLRNVRRARRRLARLGSASLLMLLMGVVAWFASREDTAATAQSLSAQPEAESLPAPEPSAPPAALDSITANRAEVPAEPLPESARLGSPVPRERARIGGERARVSARPARGSRSKPNVQRPAAAVTLQSALEGDRGRERK